MVEVMAIIRPTKMSETKQALIQAGCPGFSAHKALGRGKKPVDIVLSNQTVIQTKFVSKRVLNIIVPNEKVEKVVQAIMDVNSTGNPGDGKIFLCPVEYSYSVRTGRIQYDDMDGWMEKLTP